MNNLNVLCVEDDRYAREELTYYLKKIGVKATSAADGLEGLAKCELHNPNVIIVDLLMPQMDGISFIKVLKDQKYDGHIIVVTSVNSVDSVLEVVNLGIDYYILKPLDFSELELKLKYISDTMKPMTGTFDSIPNKRASEDAIKTRFIKSLKSYTGKGPRETVVQILGDKITITCFGALTITEENLLKDNKNFELVRQLRNVTYDTLSEQLTNAIAEVTGIPVSFEKIDIRLRKKMDQLIFKAF